MHHIVQRADVVASTPARRFTNACVSGGIVNQGAASRHQQFSNTAKTPAVSRAYIVGRYAEFGYELRVRQHPTRVKFWLARLGPFPEIAVSKKALKKWCRFHDVAWRELRNRVDRYALSTALAEAFRDWRARVATALIIAELDGDA